MTHRTQTRLPIYSFVYGLPTICTAGSRFCGLRHRWVVTVVVREKRTDHQLPVFPSGVVLKGCQLTGAAQVVRLCPYQAVAVCADIEPFTPLPAVFGDGVRQFLNRRRTVRATRPENPQASNTPQTGMVVVRRGFGPHDKGLQIIPGSADTVNKPVPQPAFAVKRQVQVGGFPVAGIAFRVRVRENTHPDCLALVLCCGDNVAHAP